MAELNWKQRYREAIVTGLIVCAAWGGIAYLAKVASPWFHSIFYATSAASLVLIACMAVMLLKRTPRGPIKPTTKNIESCVRGWLDTYKVAVRNDPGDDVFFRFQITLDSGLNMAVLRSRKHYCDYVQVVCDLGIRGEDTRAWDGFTADEKVEILLDVKTELARHGIGYSGLIDPPTEFLMFRRIPIQHNLTEFFFMSIVGDVEAGRNLVLLTFLKTRHRKDRERAIATPLLISDAPKPNAQ